MTRAVAELAEVLGSADSVNSLRNLVIRRLCADHLSRQTVLGSLEDLRRDLEDQEREVDEEVVLAVMDQVVGWCNPIWSLINFGESEYE